MGDQIKLKYEKIAERIKELRKKEGKSKTEIQEALLFPKGSLTYWENYDKYPHRTIDLDSAVKLCNYFHCDLDYLLCIHDDRYTSKNDNLRIRAAGELLDLSPKAIRNLINRRSSFFFSFDEDDIYQEVYYEGEKSNILDYLLSTTFSSTMKIITSIGNISSCKRLIDVLVPIYKEFKDKNGNSEESEKLRKIILEAKQLLELQPLHIQEAVTNIKNSFYTNDNDVEEIKVWFEKTYGIKL